VTSDDLLYIFMYSCLIFRLGNYVLDCHYWMDCLLSYVCQPECNALGNRLQNICT